MSAFSLQSFADEALRRARARARDFAGAWAAPLAVYAVLAAGLAWLSFSRPLLAGADTYYFLQAVCRGTPLNAPPLALAVFGVLPCDKAFIAGMQGLVFFACLALAASFGRLAWPERGAWAGLLALLAPGFPLFFLSFEDDLLGYPVVYAAMYLMAREAAKAGAGKGAPRGWGEASALALALAGGLLWKGAFFAVLGGGFAFPSFAVSSMIIVAGLGLNPLGAVVPSLDWFLKDGSLGLVLENGFPSEGLPGIGLVTGLFLWPLAVAGAAFFPAFPLAFFLALALLNAKALVLAVPWMAWAGTEAVKRGAGFLRGTGLEAFFFGALGVFLGASLWASWSAGAVFPPLPAHFEAIDFAAGLAAEEGAALRNEWDWGYWVAWKGFEPSAVAGPPFRYDFDGASVYLATRDLSGKGCEKAREWVWRCPDKAGGVARG